MKKETYIFSRIPNIGDLVLKFLHDRFIISSRQLLASVTTNLIYNSYGIINPIN